MGKLTRRGAALLPLVNNEQAVLISLGCALGVLVGFGALAFGYLLNAIQNIAFRGVVAFDHAKHFPDLVRGLAPWHVLLAPVVGALLVGPLVRHFAREARGHGIPEVMEAVALRNGRIRKRVAAAKIVASACTIGTGGSAGKEGPIAQIGAAIGSTLAQILRLSPGRMRTLVACGAAGGIAATFNTPIAGSIFAVEIVLGGLELTSISPVVLCAVTATVTARAFQGNVLLLAIPQDIKTTLVMVSPFEVVTYAGLGVAASAVAVLYIKTLYATEDFFEKLRRLPGWLKPALGAAGVGALGIEYPEVLSQGFETINLALLGDPRATWQLLAVLLAAKILATSLTLGSGGSGGIFAPCLVIGSLLGSLYGEAVHRLFPLSTAGSGAYALVGMGALVAAATHAPITSILILFEMTDNYRIILPLMLAATLGTVITSQTLRVSIYTLKLRRRGVTLRAGLEQSLLRSLTVASATDPDPPTISPETPFSQLVRLMTEGSLHDYPVVGRDGKLLGTISFDALRQFVFEDELAKLIIARELMRDDVPPLLGTDTLHTALDRFAASDSQEIPVVEDVSTPSRLVGITSRQRVMDTYQRELRRREAGG
ncbi:MAG: chloride channel protein [Planctomycetota bacterium]